MTNQTIDIKELSNALHKKAIQVRDSLALVIGDNTTPRHQPAFTLDNSSNAVVQWSFGDHAIYMKNVNGKLDISCTCNRQATMLEDYMNHTTDKKVTAFMTKVFEVLEIAQIILESDQPFEPEGFSLIRTLKALVS